MKAEFKTEVFQCEICNETIGYSTQSIKEKIKQCANCDDSINIY